MAPKVPSSEIGTATAGTSVARQLRRNRNTTRITSPTAIASVTFTALSEERMVTVRSMATLMSMSVGMEALQRRDERRDAIHRLDDVGAGLTVEDDQHGRLAVGEPDVAHVLDRVQYLGHVRQAHRRAVAIRDHHVAVLRGLGGLVVGVDLVALPADVDRALGGIGIGRRQRGAHVLETDAVLEQRARVQLDAHRRQRAAADLYLADAAHLRELLRTGWSRRRRTADPASGCGR